MGNVLAALKAMDDDELLALLKEARTDALGGNPNRLVPAEDVDRELAAAYRYVFARLYRHLRTLAAHDDELTRHAQKCGECNDPPGHRCDYYRRRERELAARTNGGRDGE